MITTTGRCSNGVHITQAGGTVCVVCGLVLARQPDPKDARIAELESVHANAREMWAKWQAAAEADIPVIDQLRARVQELERERDAARAECERLKRIIARELSENDELGAEYAYVLALKEGNQRLEAGAARLRGALQAACRDPLTPECRYCGVHVLRGHASDCFVGQALHAYDQAMSPPSTRSADVSLKAGNSDTSGGETPGGRMAERRGFLFKDDGRVEARGMVEYPEPRLWKYVRWVRRCLAARKGKP